MTEEDAKTKWCPFSRVVPVTTEGGRMSPLPVPAHNRIQEPGATEATWHSSHMCIASECMAWRETVKLVYADDRDTTGEAKPVGYCGLAGTP